MASKALKGKDVRKIGYPEGVVIRVVLEVMEEHYKNKSKSFKIKLLKNVFDHQINYRNDPIFGKVINELNIKNQRPDLTQLKKQRTEYSIYGAEGIEQGAIHQMEIAMKLPVAKAGALMPDAHQGYGLPIGGVLATENSVIPYGVGVDIGCRMCLTVYDISATYIDQNKSELKKLLNENTKFGHQAFKRPKDHAVLERSEFNDIKVIRDLKDKAWTQIGSSGGGNHFVEFGLVNLLDENNEFDIPTGKYLAVLSHSGSRGLGAMTARHYTRLAQRVCKLPKEAQHLAWLDLDSEEGMEYWLAMNLAGDYASACHDQIHWRMSQSLGQQPLMKVENHHNFAWKEKTAEGKEIIVHRKGATPAGKGVLGIIPGSMTAPGFIVRGKGNEASINSASHGAGRVMSRSKAKQKLNRKEVQRFLKNAGIELIGGGLDEAPMVYKDINKVMGHQQDLVEVLGTFTPKIVRMAGGR
jgi:tRNA-splicing ligase RtcB